MQRISSKVTFFHKRIFPTIWFGFLLLFIVIGGGTGLITGNLPPFPFLVVPAAMMVFGYFLMKKLVFDLLDEVWDAGDALIVRNGGQEDRIPLAEIMNVSYSPFTSPQRVTLSLRTPSMFGDKVTFCAPARFVPASTSPIVDELIKRIDAARRRAR